MEPLLIALFGGIVLVVLLLLGIHVAVALAGVGLIGLAMLIGWSSATSVLDSAIYHSVVKYLLSVVPLFILMGSVAALSGVSDGAFACSEKWLSRVPGGLLVVSIGACALFAAVSGSSAGTAAAIGKVAIPEMRQRGYDRRLATGAVAAAGTLGILIPPSIVLVIYGTVTETPIASLLIAGIIPGIVSAIIYALGVIIIVKHNPRLWVPGKPYSWRERFTSLKGIWGVALLFFVVMGGIYMGVFTSTEAAAVGAFVAFILMGLLKRRHFMKFAHGALLDTAYTTAMVFLVIAASDVFSRFLIYTSVPTRALELVANLPLPPILIVGLLLAAMIPLGMFMSAIAVLLITMPVAFPIVTGLGFDPIWFGILVTIICENALITPPVAANLYVVKSIAPDVPLHEIFQGVTWFLVMDYLTIALIMAVPPLSLWLPQRMMG